MIAMVKIHFIMPDCLTCISSAPTIPLTHAADEPTIRTADRKLPVGRGRQRPGNHARKALLPCAGRRPCRRRLTSVHSSVYQEAKRGREVQINAGIVTPTAWANDANGSHAHSRQCTWLARREVAQGLCRQWSEVCATGSRSRLGDEQAVAPGGSQQQR